MTKVLSSSGRVESLDVLRGFAAIYVLAYHVLLVPPLVLDDSLLKRVIQSGGIAVSLFFSISALSIFLGYHGKLEKETSLRAFYIRRAFRIFPLFWFCFVLHLVVRSIYGVPSGAADVLLTLTFLFPFIPGYQESLVMAGWSLGVEWLFYAMFPLFVVAINGLGRALAGLVLIAVVLVAIHDLAASMGPFNFQASFVANLPFFMIGALVFFARPQMAKLVEVFSRWRMTREAVGGMLLAVGGAFMMVVVLYSNNASFANKLLSFIGLQVAWIAILSGALVGFPVLLTNRLTIFIGRISYSIYLIHPLILVGLINSGAFSTIYSKLDSSSLAFVACLVLTFCLTLVAASLTYRWIEVPGQALGRWVLNRHDLAKRDALLCQNA